MRINNLSYKLVINKWLKSIGFDPIPTDLDYTKYATELRKLIAPKQLQIPFEIRADAIQYLRYVANQRWQQFNKTRPLDGFQP